VSARAVSLLYGWCAGAVQGEGFGARWRLRGGVVVGLCWCRVPLVLVLVLVLVHRGRRGGGLARAALPDCAGGWADSLALLLVVRL
jgi:hypothetical protein